MKALILATVSIAFGLLPLIAGDVALKPGSFAIARDPDGFALGADSIESFDQLQEHRTKEDKAAIKEMVADGHVVGIKTDSKIEIVMFSERRNAYQVRASGSTQELWLAKENVFAK
jgi:hypothetical protein